MPEDNLQEPSFATDEVMNVLGGSTSSQEPAATEGGQGAQPKPAEIKVEIPKPTENAAAPVTPPATPPAPAPVPPTVPEPVAPAGNDELTTLRAQVAELKGFVEGKNSGQPPAPAKPEDDPAHYGFQVPDEIIQHLGSENPQQVKAALGAALNGTATAVTKRVLSMQQHMIDKVIPNLINHALQVQQAQREIADDFYGKFAQLKNPIYRPLVAQAFSEVMGQGAKWDEKTRDAIGNRVMAALGAVAAPAPVVPPTSLGAPGGGARPAVPSQKDNDIFSTLMT